MSLKAKLNYNMAFVHIMSMYQAKLGHLMQPGTWVMATYGRHHPYVAQLWLPHDEGDFH